MKLPKIFADQPSAPLQFFLICLTETMAQVVLWQVEENGLVVMGQSDRVEWEGDELCVAAIDRGTLQLGKEADKVKKTLFSLPGDWVNTSGILPARKSLFQKITKELELDPVGFVVISEALVQHVKETESPQAGFFLIELTNQYVLVSLVKQGKVAHTEKVGKSGDPVSDVTEAFAHLTEKVFPSKLMLFSMVHADSELQEIRQQLFARDWKENYPFLHPPLIEVLTESQLVQALVQTAGRAYAESKHLIEPVKPTSAAAVVPPLWSEEDAPVRATNEAGDVVEVSLDEAATKDDAAEVDGASEVVKLNAPDGALPELPTFTPPNLRKFLKPNPGMHAYTPFVVLGVILGIVGLLGVGFVLAQTQVQAYVDIQLKTQTVAEDMELKLDPKIQVSDPAKKVLRAVTVTKQLEGSKTVPATGKVEVGEKAQGKVTIYNRTSSSKTFPAGTVLSIKALKFALADNVTVASESTGSNFETKPGTAEVSVTAQQVGATSNLASGVDMAVESYSSDSYVARTSSQFVGGTSREVLAVTAKDREAALATLRAELLEKAADALQADAPAGQYVVPTKNSRVLKSTYSAEVGSEADTLDLELSLEVQGLAYFGEDLTPLATAVLQTVVPAGYTLTSDVPQVLSSPLAVASGASQVRLAANVTGTAKAIADLPELQTAVAGKSPTDALSSLQSLPIVQRASVRRTPYILTLFAPRLPSSPEKIHILVSPAE